MPNLKWSDVDIRDELWVMETLLAASLCMNDQNETEHDIAINLVDKVLNRIRDLKKASEVRHA